MHNILPLINERLSARFGLSEAQGEQLARYYALLVDWNSRMNLTAITAPEEVCEKHFFDSLLLLEDAPLASGAHVLDVGTGAGLPGMVLAIARPDIEVDLLDSLGKRVTFLDIVASELGLANVHAYHDRAELFAKGSGRREAYDLVTARAVARLPLLSELCLPFVRVGGLFVALKGPDGAKELTEAQKALATLGGSHQKTCLHALSGGDERDVILIKKTAPTPKRFPRRPGDASRKPLV